MEYVRLGRSGLRVSRICLGMMSYGSSRWQDWVLDEKDARPLFRYAVENGINFFDTADAYSNGESEVLLGRFLREFIPDREDAVVATKCFSGTHDFRVNRCGLSRKHVIASCDASLQRMKLDYIDLYQIHRFDLTTPMEETLEALNDLVRAGKVRYIGASSMCSWQFAKYLHLSEKHNWARFVSMQNHYNMVYREEEREMLPLCEDEGIGVIPWSPIARGYLARSPKDPGSSPRNETDAIKDSFYDDDLDGPVARRNCELAEELGVKPAQVALAWVMANRAITAPIVGATRQYQLEDAISALEVRLTDEQKQFLEALYQPHPVLGH